MMEKKDNYSSARTSHNSSFCDLKVSEPQLKRFDRTIQRQWVKNLTSAMKNTVNE
jgi:hypothetical protein